MNEALDNLKEWSELLENVVWGGDNDPRPSDFEKTFCYGNELVDLFFSYSRVAIHYLCNDGTIVFDVIPIDKFEDWLNKGDNDGFGEGN